jgi:hypothetical protein
MNKQQELGVISSSYIRFVMSLPCSLSSRIESNNNELKSNWEQIFTFFLNIRNNAFRMILMVQVVEDKLRHENDQRIYLGYQQSQEKTFLPSL